MLKKRLYEKSVIGLMAVAVYLCMTVGHSTAIQDGQTIPEWKQRHPHMMNGIVKITPLGSQAGEFCRNDRAMLFEDSTGLRILYDPGRTIDEDDPRLGAVHVLLLSSVHSDHIGDVKPNLNSPGTCASPNTVSAAPDSVTAAIVAKKKSALFAGGEMFRFLAQKVANINGAPTASCPDSDTVNPLTLPLSAPCTGSLRPGGTRAVRLSGMPAMTITAFQAFHSNGIPASLVDAPGVAPGTTGYGGLDTGFAIAFTNGMHLFCTADSGPTVDYKFVVKDIYNPDVVVINMGDIDTFSPDLAAFVVNEWLQPNSVIPSHINQAATTNGQATGYRLLKFLDRVNRKTDVVVPLSGVTREFNSFGRCVNCNDNRRN